VQDPFTSSFIPLGVMPNHFLVLKLNETNTEQCNPEKPCLMCPKRDLESNWAAVGCRRGTLKSEMLPFSLCPMSGMLATIYFISSFTSHNVDISRFQGIERRTEALKSNNSLAVEAPELNTLLIGLESTWLVVKGLRNRDDRSNLDLPTFLDALDDCILAIINEIYDCPSASSLFGESVGDMVVLLRSAALYQTETKPGSTRESESVSPISILTFLDVIVYRTNVKAAHSTVSQLSACLS
jgi:hypothetical protein